ncbi:MAG TPA: hypothetical protein VHQ44_00535, partial [Thermoanaerobaculia bacterium]|nr:hypothetical protein [Thermoanaerobaculia bacterium]
MPANVSSANARSALEPAALPASTASPGSRSGSGRIPYRAVYWMVRSGSNGRRTLRAASLSTYARLGLRNEPSERRSALPRSGYGRVRVWIGVRSIVIAVLPTAARPRDARGMRTALPAGATVTPRSSGFFQTPPSQRERASVRSLRTAAAPSPSGCSLVILRKTRSFCLSTPNRSGSTFSEKPVVISRPASEPLTYGV